MMRIGNGRRQTHSTVTPVELRYGTSPVELRYGTSCANVNDIIIFN
jgi:hypothetical protein